ncbi:MAG: bifunctional folylpolyglutamate synthase/dihydrofolate synthase [Kiritimatiellae bacterium]|nr:bifunctional folylpolyglutamate synthase/dihydrofolate synthase [Kiritimatiellia bacterium]
MKQLTDRRRFGIKPGLEKIRFLLERLGNPHHSVAAIHIAGTNGKGSVAAICDSVLRAAGYPAGRYTSPHLNSINERFLINGMPVSDKVLLSAAEQVMAQITTMEREQDLYVTFFEAMTAIAFLLFREAGLRLAVLETGLGGRLDATNVVEPLVSVITRVGLDHCEWLGETIAEIAAEKGGIIKPGRPVVVAANCAEVLALLAGCAADCGAPLVMAAERVSLTRVAGDLTAQTIKISTGNRTLPKITTLLAARYQLENIAAAVCALDVLHELGVAISDDAFVKGLAQVSWPGRFQKVCDHPVVILDAAHNLDGAEALRQSLKQCGIKDHVMLVTGFCAEKDAIGFLKRLQGVVKVAWAVTIDNPRALAAPEVGALMRSAGMREVVETASAVEAIHSAMQCAQAEGGTVVVTGSIFLVAEALELFDRTLVTGQRNLNESGEGKRASARVR